MDKDEIIRMAREAGFEVVDGELRLYFDGSKALLKPNYMGTVVDGLKAFAALVAAHEREKRTKELMQLFLDPENQPTQFGTATLEHREEEIAAAYARGHDEGGKDFESIFLPAAIAAEREACAKVCEEIAPWGNSADDWAASCLNKAAKAIRARNNND